MATVNKYGKPLVISVCFACDGESIYTPIDKKPKRVKPEKLKRFRNIIQNPNVSLVIDNYSEDWAQLSYIIINGKAHIIYEGAQYTKSLELLTQKYDQYLQMDLRRLGLPVIKITPEKIISWGN